MISYGRQDPTISYAEIFIIISQFNDTCHPPQTKCMFYWVFKTIFLMEIQRSMEWEKMFNNNDDK